VLTATFFRTNRLPRQSRWIPAALGVLAMACLSSAPAFGQCTLNGAANGCVLNGPVTVTTTYNAPNNTATTANGTITNNGVMTFTSGANNTILDMNGSTTLNGAGTVTLSETGGGAVIFQQTVGGVTLTNFNNLIQGAGIIGNGGLTLANESGGTISANSSGQTLFLDGSGGVTNNGLLKATNSGILQLLSATVANAGGNITADGGTVQVNSAVINGGTLNSVNGGVLQTIGSGVATLNGVTLSTGSTYTTGNNTDLFVSGTITNNGNIQVNAAANNTILGLNANTTLTGGGTLTLAQSAGGAPIIQQESGNLTLENVNNTIQGAGTIGNGGLTLLNDVGGKVTANASGQTLFLDGSGGVTNQGLLKATGGGTFELLSTTVNNAGGNITADGGTVLVNNAVINGGTLNSVNGGALGTVTDGIATLNGITLSTGSTYTTGNDTDLFVSGTITNNGSIQVNAAANNTILGLNANTTLTGGGTLTLAQSAGGAPIIQQESGGLTLTNQDNLIQGAGTIGNGGLVLLNQAGGTVNANASGQTLFLDGSGGVTNQGLLTATNGGTLELLSTTVNNAGGNITGNGGTVVLNSATIQGGTLNGTLQTIANGVATLDGTTHGAITLSPGATYTAGNNTDLFVQGSIVNGGNIQVNAAANNTILGLNANTTLTGGGTLTLAESGGGAAIIQQETGGLTLTNTGNTIQGAGVIGNGGLTVVNGVDGTILANAAGQTLLINGSGGLTNNGALQVAAGSTMHVTSPFTNFSGNTLTGGIYAVNGTVPNPGTLQIDALGTTGGEIVNNASTIVLNGPTAEITDKSNLNALANFQDNLAGGNFILENGQNFITGANGTNFENDGSVAVGQGSSFTTANDYTQGGGLTLVDGTLTATGGQVNINGGTLSGSGTIFGNVNINAGGTLSPGLFFPGKINISGNYSQSGTLDEGIIGLPASGFFDVTNVTAITGAGVLGGTLDISILNGFQPGVNSNLSYLIMTAGGGFTGQFGTVDFLNNTLGDTYSVDYSHEAQGEVFLDINGPVITTGQTPEPVEFLPIIGIVAALIGRKMRNRRRAEVIVSVWEG
jgi:fibronectin-binding autotransporter adhesin